MANDFNFEISALCFEDELERLLENSLNELNIKDNGKPEQLELEHNGIVLRVCFLASCDGQVVLLWPFMSIEVDIVSSWAITMRSLVGSAKTVLRLRGD